MSNSLSHIIPVAVLVYSVTSMLSVGLGTALRSVLGPLRDVGAVSRALIANFVLVPLLALGILRLLPLDWPLETGLLLLSTAAGAPFLVKLTEAAEGRLGTSAALLVALLPVTVLYMPIAVPVLVPGTTVSAVAIATPLVLTMLLPLVVGLVFRARLKERAPRLLPRLQTVSTVALLVFVAATIWRNAATIADLLSQGTPILAGVSAIVSAFVIGYGFGGRQRHRREVLGLGTAQRNVAASMVVATQSFHDPRVNAMVVVTSLLTLVVLFPIALTMRRLRPPTPRDNRPPSGRWPR